MQHRATPPLSTHALEVGYGEPFNATLTASVRF